MRKIVYFFILLSIISIKMEAQCDASFAFTSNSPIAIDTLVVGNSVAVSPSQQGPNLLHMWKYDNTPYVSQFYHQYNSPGLQTICHAIFDSISLCTDTACENLLVLGCGAYFYIYPDTNGPPHTYIGSNACFGNNLTYNWSWGDGNNSTGPYPSHTYGAAGNYNICVMIDDGLGCLDTFCNFQTINKNTAMYSVDFANIPSNIIEDKKNKVELFPNPVYDFLYINNAEKRPLQVLIYRIDGSLVSSENIKAGESINFSKYPLGIYPIKIFDGNVNILNTFISKVK